MNAAPQVRSFLREKLREKLRGRKTSHFGEEKKGCVWLRILCEEKNAKKTLRIFEGNLRSDCVWVRCQPNCWWALSMQ